MFLSNIFDDILKILNNPEYTRWLWQGLFGTIVIALVGTIGGLFLGIFLAFGKRLTINKKDSIIKKIILYPIKTLSTIYSVVMRGTPMMVQALLFQYIFLTFGFDWNDVLRTIPVFNGWFIAGCIIIVLNTAAYMGEIIISGLNGVGVDQTEGAKSLGMNSFQTLIYVTLPQAIKQSIPTIGNELIVNIKDSSVLNVISVTELFFQAKTIAGSSYKYMAIYIIIAICYLILTLIVTLILKFISYKMNGGQIKFGFIHYRLKNCIGD